MFTLTGKAAERLHEIRWLKQTKGFLRIALEKRGENRWVFQMGFDAERKGDYKTESQGVITLMDRRTAKALDGVTVDFTQTAGRGTFVFTRTSIQDVGKDERDDPPKPAGVSHHILGKLKFPR